MTPRAIPNDPPDDPKITKKYKQITQMTPNSQKHLHKNDTTFIPK